MRKKSDTVRYTAKQISARIQRGEDRTNRRRANAVTGKKLDASILADPDDVRGGPDWTKAIMGVPAPKDHINIRIDHDVLAWFRANGRGYQTLMNNVLRTFVQSRKNCEIEKGAGAQPLDHILSRGYLAQHGAHREAATPAVRTLVVWNGP